MDFKSLMSYLSDQIGLDGLKPDENGECQLFCEETAITIQDCPSINMLLMAAPVAQMQEHEDSVLLKTLLEANFAFAGTRGATLSIDPATSILYLSRYDALNDLSQEHFYKDFLDFVTVLYKWQKRIEDYRHGHVESLEGANTIEAQEEQLSDAETPEEDEEYRKNLRANSVIGV